MLPATPAETSVLPRELYPHCTLIACLRRGAWTDGYLALAGDASPRHVYMDRVAPDFGADPGFTSQLGALARGVVARTHPRLVTLFDIREVEGALWLMHELVFGCDAGALLARCRARGVRVPVPLAWFAAEAAAQGVAHLHARGEVHGAVSAAHLLVGYDGDVKLARACVREPWRTWGAGWEVHRLRYFAPEQVAAGRPLDARSDVFALGAVLYALLVGQSPFHASNSLATLERVRAAEVAPPSHAVPEVPDALDAVVLRALARAPADRYATAAELAQALADARVAAMVPTSAQAMGRFVRELFAPEVEQALAHWAVLKRW